MISTEGALDGVYGNVVVTSATSLQTLQSFAYNQASTSPSTTQSNYSPDAGNAAAYHHAGYHKLEHYATLATPGVGSAAASSGAGSIRVDPMYSKIEIIAPYKSSMHGTTAQVKIESK